MNEQVQKPQFQFDLNPGATTGSNLHHQHAGIQLPTRPHLFQSNSRDESYVDQQVKSKVDAPIAELRQSLVSDIVAAIQNRWSVLSVAEVPTDQENLPAGSGQRTNTSGVAAPIDPKASERQSQTNLQTDVHRPPNLVTRPVVRDSHFEGSGLEPDDEDQDRDLDLGDFIHSDFGTGSESV
jgi:hypothetical protein